MITLLTGLPGNGKTLYAIAYVKAWAEKENRPVFYSGINELALDWTEIDPEKWFEAPAGAIIVIDECQRVFRPRSFGSQVPEYVSRLETHRHQGLDLVLITQHPLLVDSSIRRLSGRHLHLVRKWGTQAATIHEWNAVKDNCDKNGSRHDSIKHAFKFDKSIYSLYKSAEIHTVKRAIPLRVWFLYVIMPLLLLAAFYYMWLFVDKRRNPDKYSDKPAVQSVQSDQKQPVQTVSRPKETDPLADAKKYVFNYGERVEGLPHTSPRYDDVTKPTTAPVPVACVASESKCSCYSQQGTKINVTAMQCRQIVDSGFFIDFDLDRTKIAKQDKKDSPAIINGQAVPVSSLNANPQPAPSIADKIRT